MFSMTLFGEPSVLLASGCQGDFWTRRTIWKTSRPDGL